MRSKRAKSVKVPAGWLSAAAVLALCLCEAVRAEESSGTDWWLGNLTNGSELCMGMIDINSSEPIYSFLENSTAGEFIDCKFPPKWGEGVQRC